jgi:VIT1/CCC1 family predicted Fe2+/Mn2+ transporter
MQRQKFLHHYPPFFLSGIREIVFGLEDGMVSTLGAITGIAIGTQSQFTVILSGAVIVAVESFSMAVGSYLSNKSEAAVDTRKIAEERFEISEYPEEEERELLEMFVRDGWPKDLAKRMARHARGAKEKNLMLREMAYRELHILPDKKQLPFRNAFVMYFSYILGGVVPIIPYFFFTVAESLRPSVVITLSGLFLLGALTALFTKRSWWSSGFEMLFLGGLALLLGITIGSLASGISFR